MQDTLLLRACLTGLMRTEGQEFQREFFFTLSLLFKIVVENYPKYVTSSHCHFLILPLQVF